MLTAGRYAPAAVRSVTSPTIGRSTRAAAAAAVALGIAAGAVVAVNPILPPAAAVAAGLVVVWLAPGWLAIGGIGAGDGLGACGCLALAPVAGLALWALPLAVCFAAGLPLWVAAVAVVLAAAALAGRGLSPLPARADAAALTGLAAAGGLLGWRWQSALVGDALFHAGVVRKLLALQRLSLSAIWPFRDGHPHAGYAFPLLHAAQAAAVGLTRLDPSFGYAELVPAFAALVAVVAYATGRAIAGQPGGIATGLLALWVGVTGSQSVSVAQQPRYVVTLLLVPAVLLLLIEIRRDPSPPLRVLLVAAVAAIAVLHSTYAPVVVLMIAAVAAGCRPLRRDAAIAALVLAAIAGWIYWQALWGLHYHPPQALAPLGFVSFHGHRIALSGIQVFQRRPEYVAALAVLLVALWRRSGALSVVAIAAAVAYLAAALPGAAPLASRLIGAGQAQRFGEEIPWVYLLGGAIGELAMARRAVVIAAAGAIAAVAVERSGVLGTAAASGLGMAGAVAVLVLLVLRLGDRRPLALPSGAGGRVAAAALLAVAVVAGSIDAWGKVTWASAHFGKPQPTVDDRLTPAALRFFHSNRSGIPVVLAPFSASFGDWYSGISYQLVGTATVYTVAISAYHSASELRDDPAGRRRAVSRFLSPATSEAARRWILRHYDVAYVAVDLRTTAPATVAALAADPGLRTVFRDRAATPGHCRLRVFEVLGG